MKLQGLQFKEAVRFPFQQTETAIDMRNPHQKKSYQCVLNMRDEMVEITMINRIDKDENGKDLMGVHPEIWIPLVNISWMKPDPQDKEDATQRFHSLRRKNVEPEVEGPMIHVSEAPVDEEGQEIPTLKGPAKYFEGKRKK